MKQANVYVNNNLAGVLTEDDLGYEFRYNSDYLKSEGAEAVSLTLPLSVKPYRDKVLFPFFDGLIPEGWLLDIAERSWKISARDRFSLLLACCKDCIGNVSVIPLDEKEIEDV
ncbi:MAG: HipA N-terminal domain-containing protein [Muribaculaceae bacterium]|nr:HipA N-terminal domain-containing protein [Muribaculaceae bacterium]